MKRLLLLGCLALLFAVAVSAQTGYGFRPLIPHVELYGHIGSETESYSVYSSRTEFGYGGSFGVFITRNLEVEFNVESADDFLMDTAYSYDYQDNTYTINGTTSHKNLWTEANVLYHYGGSDVFRPFFMGSLGNVHRKYLDVIEPLVLDGDVIRPGEILTTKQDHFTWGVGGGVKIFLLRHVGLRMEYKISSVDGDAVHRFRAGLSLFL